MFHFQASFNLMVNILNINSSKPLKFHLAHVNKRLHNVPLKSPFRPYILQIELFVENVAALKIKS